ncbi:hypothetical protein LZ31DRAFT_556546 [Colletotrichum somersetense]|nr:hypothetical protein LZ31DRAFT_556546 [Colletotrichum somersetense]
MLCDRSSPKTWLGLFPMTQTPHQQQTRLESLGTGLCRLFNTARSRMPPSVATTISGLWFVCPYFVRRWLFTFFARLLQGQSVSNLWKCWCGPLAHGGEMLLAAWDLVDQGAELGTAAGKMSPFPARNTDTRCRRNTSSIN